eukprot:8437628-Pyramimonas_sp.AAC.1
MLQQCKATRRNHTSHQAAITTRNGIQLTRVCANVAIEVFFTKLIVILHVPANEQLSCCLYVSSRKAQRPYRL